MNHGEEVPQCRGDKVDGTRCSRNGNHNGYCHQHRNQAPDNEAAGGGGSLSSIELSSIGYSEGGEKVPQCRGMTLNNTRCSRNGIHNGYCKTHMKASLSHDDEAASSHEEAAGHQAPAVGDSEGGEKVSQCRGMKADGTTRCSRNGIHNGYCKTHIYQASLSPDYGAAGGGGSAQDYYDAQTPPDTDTEEDPPEHTAPPAARPPSFLSRLLWSQPSSSPSPGSHIGMEESHSDSASVNVNPNAADADSNDECEYIVDKRTADEAVRIVIDHFLKKLREQEMMFQSQFNLIQAENQALKASAGKKTKIGSDQYNRAVLEYLNAEY